MHQKIDLTLDDPVVEVLEDPLPNENLPEPQQKYLGAIGISINRFWSHPLTVITSTITGSCPMVKGV